MEVTRLVRLEGSAMTVSPFSSTPAARVPQNPRKSRLGRFTYCTGRRRSLKFTSPPMSTDSSRLSSVGPAYQGMLAPWLTTFSPLRAETGTKRTSGMLRDLASSW